MPRSHRLYKQFGTGHNGFSRKTRVVVAVVVILVIIAIQSSIHPYIHPSIPSFHSIISLFLLFCPGQPGCPKRNRARLPRITGLAPTNYFNMSSSSEAGTVEPENLDPNLWSRCDWCECWGNLGQGVPDMRSRNGTSPIRCAGNVLMPTTGFPTSGSVATLAGGGCISGKVCPTNIF